MTEEKTAEKKIVAHVSEAKKKELEDIKKHIKEYPIMGIANMENLPALQLQRIKQQLKDKIVIKMTKKRLIKLAFDQLKDEKKNLEQLKEKLEGMPALIFTKENPFKLYKLLDKNKSLAKAKPGQIAPKDLVVSAGPTSFMPGPIIGELGAARIKAGVEEGKVVIKEDSVVAKKGEPIDAKVADILARLGVEPMEVGLNLLLTYENGEILTQEILGVSEEEYIEKIKQASLAAINLAVNSSYMTKETVEILIKKAFTESKAIVEKADISTSEGVGAELAKAEQQASKLKEQLPEEKVEEKAEVKEEPKEEAQVEEKKEEKPIEEKPKEEPKVEEPKFEEEKEIPKTELEKEMEQEPKPEEVERDEEEKVFVETKEEVKEGDMEKAKQVLDKLTDEKIKTEKKVFKTEKKEERPKKGVEDMSKLINELKDKKFKEDMEKKKK